MKVIIMDKKLCLSRTNKVFAGVCGGIAEYLKVDATLVRIIWVLLSLAALMAPVVLYIICWALMPLPPSE